MEREELIEEFFNSGRLLHKAWKSRFYKALGDEDIPMTQAVLLFLINEEQPVSGKSLAKKMHITKSATTQLIDSLYKLGFVERSNSTEDKRVTYLKLTTLGKKKISRLETKRKNLFKEVATALSTEEIELMNKIQIKMLEKLESKVD